MPFVIKTLPHRQMLMALIAMACPCEAATAIWNANLIENPGAEQQIGTALGANNRIAGWETPEKAGDTTPRGVDTAASAHLYNAYAAMRPDVRSGFTTPGLNYFYSGGTIWSGGGRAGSSGPGLALEQRINVSALLRNSRPGATWAASAWFGGVASQDSSAWFHVSFLDANGNLLGDTSSIGGVTARERNNQSNRWLQRSTVGYVPQETEWVVFGVSFDSVDPLSGLGGNGGIDDLHFSMTPSSAVPEPGASALLAALSLGRLSARRRR